MKSLMSELLSESMGKKPKKGSWAVEVEAEFKTPFTSAIPEGWVAHNEPSLRGHGIEFVNKGPVEKEKLFQLLDELFAKREFLEEYIDSPRASIHVHQNIESWGFDELIKYMLLYYFIEPVLWRLAGEQRSGNIFCLDATRASNVISDLKLLFKKDWNGLHNAFDRIKYASLNFGCITKFGSLEYRQLEGTNNADRIKQWVNVLEKIKMFAFQFDTIQDVWKQICADNRGTIIAATGLVPTVHEQDMHYSFCFLFYNEYLNSLKKNNSYYHFEQKEIE